MNEPRHPRSHESQAARAYIGLLLFGFSVCFMIYGIQPLLREIADEFASGMSGMGTLVAVFLFGLCLSPFGAAPVIDRIGARRTILAGGTLLAASLAILPLCGSYGFLLAVRCFQAAIVPISLTAVLSSVSYVFRHMDLTRGIAGYFAVNLCGSLSSRVLGGWVAELVGWRLTLAIVAPIFLASVLLVAFNLPDPPRNSRHSHSLKDYLDVFRVPRAATLLYAEACSLFVFAGVGNLIPFRIAELDASAGTGRTGTMYVGYLLGVAVSLSAGWLLKRFGGPTRLLAVGGALYALAFLPMSTPSQTALFGSVWLVAAANYVVHSVAPGFLNRSAVGHCARPVVNGLYYSTYSLGGLLGALVPVLVYERLGWTCAFGVMEAVLLSSFLALLRLHRRQPDFGTRR